MIDQLQTTEFYRRIHNFPTNKKDYRARIASIVRRDQEITAANRADGQQWSDYYRACSCAAHLQNNADKFADTHGVTIFFALYKEVKQLASAATLADLEFTTAVNAEMRSVNEAVHLARQARRAAAEAQNFLYGELRELSETELAALERDFLAWREDCRAGRRGWND